VKDDDLADFIDPMLKGILTDLIVQAMEEGQDPVRMQMTRHSRTKKAEALLQRIAPSIRVAAVSQEAMRWWNACDEDDPDDCVCGRIYDFIDEEAKRLHNQIVAVEISRGAGEKIAQQIYAHLRGDE